MSDPPFSNICGNFQRFVDLSRASHQRSSLSPERELRQMTYGGYTRIEDSTAGSPTSGTKKEDTIDVDHPLPPLLEVDATQVQFAQTWQYGSALYHPVTDRFYCSCSNDLHLKAPETYAVEGVSCDFCGFTYWNQKPKSAQSSGLYFFHCDSCATDLCPFCIHDTYSNERCHAPCMQCRQCGAFVYLERSTLHRCTTTVEENAQLQRKTSDYLEELKRGFLAAIQAQAEETVVEPPPKPAAKPKSKSKSATPGRKSVSKEPRTSVKKEDKKPVPQKKKVSPKKTPTPPSETEKKTTPGPWEVLLPFFSTAEKNEVEGTLHLLGVPPTLSSSEELGVPCFVVRYNTRLGAERCASAIQDLGLSASVRHTQR
ncbi:hypothetical protein ADEAN_000227600 [Angomonas deanei]|uniref:Uncharacterized protein n=1 Tax=Angomonas deanei TaxID=59799 RepID=A0A7G2C5Q8_9TRYP|nr:hypothetical protein ADEAN_000227600 [Angomonas deanei]